MSDHLAEAARHLRAALDHLMLHDVDDVATLQATIDMAGELRRSRLFYVMKGLESVGETAEEFAASTSAAARASGVSTSELHRHMKFNMDGGPITEYECTDHHA